MGAWSSAVLQLRQTSEESSEDVAKATEGLNDCFIMLCVHILIGTPSLDDHSDLVLLNEVSDRIDRTPEKEALCQLNGHSGHF